MPGIKEPSPPPPSSPPTNSPPQLETTSNLLPSTGHSELFGELNSTYHPPSSDTTIPPPPSSDSPPPPSLPELQSRSRRVQIRNRRLHYLTTHHTTYFSNPALELADPLLYDKCIRSFQTASEREEDGKRKGWSGVLHADLERAEARMEALRKATESRNRRDDDGDGPDEEEEEEEEDEEEKVKTKEEGAELWEDAMTRRFLEGRDDDMDYKMIDDNEEYDDVKQIERDVQEAYFDAETPGDAVEGQACTDTGIQDF